MQGEAVTYHGVTWNRIGPKRERPAGSVATERRHRIPDPREDLSPAGEAGMGTRAGGAQNKRTQGIAGPNQGING
jgi:hypothetical protein